MTKIFTLPALALGAFLLAPVSGEAATIQYLSGSTTTAIGVENVDVGGTLYDVAFTTVRQSEIPTTYVFTDYATTKAALGILGDALNVANITAISYGPSYSYANSAATTWYSNDSTTAYGTVVRLVSGTWTTAYNGVSTSPLNTTAYQFSAVWTVAGGTDGAVPLPAAAWLLAAGLTGFAALRRRIRY